LHISTGLVPGNGLLNSGELMFFLWIDQETG